MVKVIEKDVTALVRELLGRVTDPEIPVLTLEDLGVIRDVQHTAGRVEITITPTYAGCPAIEAMRADIETTLAAAGFDDVTVRQSLSPAWTTDWMSTEGRRKLQAYGIAPPARKARDQVAEEIECPQCGSVDVERISEFGSTACKALYKCRACLEPFDYFKCL